MQDDTNVTDAAVVADVAAEEIVVEAGAEAEVTPAEETEEETEAAA